MRATNSSLSPRCNLQIEIHAEDSWTVFLCQVESRNHSPEMFLEGGRRDGGGGGEQQVRCFALWMQNMQAQAVCLEVTELQ